MECVETTLSHPALKVRRFVGAEPFVRYWYHLEFVSNPITFIVHNSSIVNLTRAVLTRVLMRNGKEPYRPDEDVYKRLNKFKSSFLKHLLEGLPSTTPMSILEFPDLYRGRRKTVYQGAAESLLHRPITRDDACLKAFIKAERVNGTAKLDPDPRVIQPRDPRYNVELGVYLKPLENTIYQAVARLFHCKTIFKGMNACESGKLMFKKWSRFRCPVAVGLDASRFDQHVSPAALKWEHSLYNRVYKNDPKLQMLLDWQVHNRAKGWCRDGTLRYNVNGCRMSGDMNTALGNCLIMCALVYAYMDFVSIGKYELANNGDDCIVIMEKHHVARFQLRLESWFLEMGFVMKVEAPVYEFEQIDFCQTSPVWRPDGYVMVRRPQVSLAKDSISIKPLDSPGAWCSWLTSISCGGMALTSGIPVVQEYYAMLQRSVKQSYPRYKSKMGKDLDPLMETGMMMWAKGLIPRYQPVDDHTRYSFWLAFGIEPDMQLAIEDYYRNNVLVYKPIYGGEPVHMPPWLS
jgi:hypothetical protein